MEKLPEENDVIVLGTGMTESIVAAALSRIEMRVLHLDKNDHYGGAWGSFNLLTLEEFLQANMDSTISEDNFSKCNSDLKCGERIIKLQSQKQFLKNISHYDLRSKVSSSADSACLDVSSIKLEGNQKNELNSSEECNQKCSETETNSPNKPVSETFQLFETLQSKGRYFSIDLIPKMMYSRGPLIELLISSDVARYCEFKLVSRILTYINDKFEAVSESVIFSTSNFDYFHVSTNKVPSSRSEVFSTSNVSVIEKRMLMKFLTFAHSYENNKEEYEGHEDQLFVEFLKEKKLSQTLQHYIQHAIAMVPNSATTLQGLAAVQKYLVSLGRYGNSSFLSPLYGTGELLQCFCRMSSVFGGTYCLRNELSAFIVDESDRIVEVVDGNGQVIKTNWVIIEASYANQLLLTKEPKTTSISRAILVTNKSIHPGKEQHISLINIPSPVLPDTDVIVQELCPSSRACPDNCFVVYMTCPGIDAKSDLGPVVDKFFNCPYSTECDEQRDVPDVLWMTYFNIESIQVDPFESKFENLIVIPGPDPHLDCDVSVALAEIIFKKICPNEVFLPKAPSPEEIKFFEETTTEGIQVKEDEASKSISDGEISPCMENKTDPTEGHFDADTHLPA